MSESQNADVARVFGENQKFFRNRKKWLQTDLAKHLRDAGLPKYSQVAVSRTEEGKRTVRLDEATIIARVLGITLDRLLSPPDSFERRTEAIRETLGLVLDARVHLLQAAESYEETRMSTEMFLVDLKNTEEQLRLNSVEAEGLHEAMRDLSIIAQENAVELVQDRVIDDIDPAWLLESLKHGND